MAWLRTGEDAENVYETNDETGEVRAVPKHSPAPGMGPARGTATPPATAPAGVMTPPGQPGAGGMATEGRGARDAERGERWGDDLVPIAAWKPRAKALPSDPELRALATQESTGGTNKGHDRIKAGAMRGQFAAGSYGLTPPTVRQVVNDHPKLREKYGALIEGKSPNEITNLINADDDMDDEIAAAYWSDVKRQAGDDVDEARLRWYGGRGVKYQAYKRMLAGEQLHGKTLDGALEMKEDLERFRRNLDGAQKPVVADPPGFEPAPRAPGPPTPADTQGPPSPGKPPAMVSAGMGAGMFGPASAALAAAEQQPGAPPPEEGPGILARGARAIVDANRMAGEKLGIAAEVAREQLVGVSPTNRDVAAAALMAVPPAGPAMAVPMMAGRFIEQNVQPTVEAVEDAAGAAQRFLSAPAGQAGQAGASAAPAAAAAPQDLVAAGPRAPGPPTAEDLQGPIPPPEETPADALRRQIAEQRQAYQGMLNESMGAASRDKQQSRNLLNTKLAANLDPERLWKSKGTLAQIVAVIAQGLGAAGASLTGGPNMAMQIIQQMVADDLDAQRADMANKDSAYAQFVAQAGDEARGRAMLLEAKYQVIQGLVDELDAEMRGMAQAGGRIPAGILAEGASATDTLRQLNDLQERFGALGSFSGLADLAPWGTDASDYTARRQTVIAKIVFALSGKQSNEREQKRLEGMLPTTWTWGSKGEQKFQAVVDWVQSQLEALDQVAMANYGKPASALTPEERQKLNPALEAAAPAMAGYTEGE